MKPTQAELVYESLSGHLADTYRVPGIENAFAPGTPCEMLYRDILLAYFRLCQRLGVEEEDADIEIIMNSFLDIERILCLKMFDLGAKHGRPA